MTTTHPTEDLGKNQNIALAPVEGASFADGVNALLTDLLRRNTAGELVSLSVVAKDTSGNKITARA